LKNKIPRALILREHLANMDIIIDVHKSYISERNIDKKIKFKTDNNGYIIGNEQNSDSRNKLFFLGGSTTENSWIAQGLRFPELLNSYFFLNKVDYIAYNSGVSGSNSFHSLLVLLSKIIKEKPKKIFIMHSVNDYSHLRINKTYYEGDKEKNPIIQAKNFLAIHGGETISGISYDSFSQRFLDFAKTTKDLLLPNFYYFASTSFKKIKRINELDNIELVNSEVIKYYNKSSIIEIEKEFIKNMKVFIELSKIYDFEIIFLIQPNLYYLEYLNFRENNQNFIKSFQELNNEELSLLLGSNYLSDRLIDLCINYSVDFIDLRKQISNYKNEEIFIDQVHFNEKGNKIISEKIIRYLKKN
jgi:lysophospholipase L1-like esterase